MNKDSIKELEPCPFCGNKTVRIVGHGGSHRRIECMPTSPGACGASIVGKTDAEVRHIWNTRQLVNDLVTEVAKEQEVGKALLGVIRDMKIAKASLQATNTQLEAEQEKLVMQIAEWMDKEIDQKLANKQLEERVKEVRQDLKVEMVNNKSLKAQLQAEAWVSVDERLPKDIAFDVYTERVIVRFAQGHIDVAFYNCEDNTFCESNTKIAFISEATHWKPITTPPEKKKKVD